MDGYTRQQLKDLCTKHKDLLKLDCRSAHATIYEALLKHGLLPGKKSPMRPVAIQDEEIDLNLSPYRTLQNYCTAHKADLIKSHGTYFSCKIDRADLVKIIDKWHKSRHQVKKASPRKVSPKKVIPKPSPKKVIPKPSPKKAIPKPLPKKISPPKGKGKGKAIPKPSPKKAIPIKISPPKGKGKGKGKEKPKQAVMAPMLEIDKCLDWQVCSKKEQWGNYHIITIPKNTLLYKGRPIAYNPPYQHKYYGDRVLASMYAFAASTVKDHIPDFTPEDGTIEVYRTTDDLHLINMESIPNYDLMEQLPGYDKKAAANFFSAFGYQKGGRGGLNRYSYTKVDHPIADWICSQPELKGIDGYGYYKIRGFHNEIMLCDAAKIEKTDYEWRYITYYQPNVIHEVVDDGTGKKVFTGKTKPFEGESYRGGGGDVVVSDYIVRNFDDRSLKIKEKKYLTSPEFHYLLDPAVAKARQAYYLSKGL